MKDFHVAVIGHPMPPHVGPTLPVVSTLVRRGYRVTYVTSRSFASRVAATGATVVETSPFRPFTTLEPYEKQNFQHPYCRAALRTLATVMSVYENDKPGLIVYDLVAFAGRILAHQWKIPAVQTCPTFALRRATFDRSIENPDFRRELFELGAHADRFLTNHGISNSDFLFHRERLNIYFVPRDLQPDKYASDESCFFAGRCPGEQLYYGQWHRTQDHHGPTILVSTSTVYLQGPEFFKLCIDTLVGFKGRVILSVGDHMDVGSLGPLPPHFEIVQGAAHVMILPHVSLFICLGGNITAAEAAYHGVPLIVTSHGFTELEYQGDNIENAGLGLHLRKNDLDVDNLRSAVTRVLGDATLLNKVRLIQRSVRREPGAEEVANRIEEYLDAYGV
jgi:MGT family glycosyltransferase